MFEHAVDRLTGRFEKRGHGLLSPIRPNASAAARRLCIEGAWSSLTSSRHGLAVAPEADGMNRGLADGFVGIRQGTPRT